MRDVGVYIAAANRDDAADRLPTTVAFHTSSSAIGGCRQSAGLVEPTHEEGKRDQTRAQRSIMVGGWGVKSRRKKTATEPTRRSGRIAAREAASSSLLPSGTSPP
jgi:hypothetical protein